MIDHLLHLRLKPWSVWLLAFVCLAVAVGCQGLSTDLDDFTYSSSDADAGQGADTGDVADVDAEPAADIGDADVADDTGSDDVTPSDVTPQDADVGDECPPIQVIDSNIEQSETWEAFDGDCPEYRVEGGIQISGSLTIEAGVTVRFAESASLEVPEGGMLTTQGTSDAAVRLTGEQDGPGYWRGIFIQSVHPNKLEYTVVEGAGGGSFDSSLPDAGLVVGIDEQPAQIALEHSKFQDHDGFGVFIHPDSELTDFHDNVLIDNTRPMSLHPRHLDGIDSTSTFAGNDNDRVLVVDGEIEEAIDSDTYISAIDVPYESQGIVARNFVTIEAGAQFQFTHDARFRILDSGLAIEGELDNPVLMSATEQTPGWWKGLVIEGTQHPSNEIEHLIVEYAGGSSQGTFVEAAGLTVGNHFQASSTKITGSIFRENDGHGLYLHDNSSFSDFAQNTFTQNDKFGLSINSASIGVIPSDSDLVFDDNGDGPIVVRGGNIDDDTVWQNIEAPWYVSDDITVGNDATATVRPGVEIRFETTTSLKINGGVLRVEASEMEPAIFRGQMAEAGSWDGLFIESTPEGTTSHIEYLNLRHAGAKAHHSTSKPAGIAVGRSLWSADVHITNSTIRDISHSGEDAYGIYVHPGSSANTDICDSTVNAFENIDGTNCTTSND